LKLNGTIQILVYACDNTSILSGSINAKKEHTGTSLVSSKETGLEVHAANTKYIGMSRHQNAGKISQYKNIINPLKR